ncbi:MAG: hypothetical protein B7X43_04385, partial [Thiomonas sp. 15-63-373]
IALAGFVVPYMAVYDPQLMLQGDWTWLGVAYVTSKAILAIVLWGAVAVGYLRGPMSVLERLLAFCAAALLITALPMTDEAGFALAAIVLLWHGLRARGLAAQATT